MSEELETVNGELMPALATYERASSLQRAIQEAGQRASAAWVECAAGLWYFREEQAWLALGYESFEAWVSQPDLALPFGRRQHFRMLEVYRTLVVEHGVEPVALAKSKVSNLSEVLPAVRRKQVTVEEALNDANTLSVSDLRAEYGGGKSGPKLDPQQEPEWTTCPTCHRPMKVEQAASSGGSDDPIEASPEHQELMKGMPGMPDPSPPFADDLEETPPTATSLYYTPDAVVED